jgi:hypothetical protein
MHTHTHKREIWTRALKFQSGCSIKNCQKRLKLESKDKGKFMEIGYLGTKVTKIVYSYCWRTIIWGL